MNETSPKASKKFKISFGVILLLLAVSIYYNYSFSSQIKVLKDPGAASQRQIDKTLAEIGKFIELPSDEVPTLAVVNDLSQLQGQEFFAKAALGDQLIVYAKARKAILWRPSEHKIIEAAPLSSDQSAAAPAPVSVPEPVPTASAVVETPTPSPSPKKK